MFDPRDIEARVANGVEYLDAFMPDWWEKLDLDHLDLGNECSCVLGQLVKTVKPDANYTSVAYTWRYGPPSNATAIDVGMQDVLSLDEAADLGFHLRRDEDDHSSIVTDAVWQALTDEWRRVTLQRRQGAEVAQATATEGEGKR